MARRGFPITKDMRAERRARAEKVQQAYQDKYPTTQDKLNALPETGAAKQRAKLQARLEAEQEAARLAAQAKEEAKVKKAK